MHYVCQNALRLSKCITSVKMHYVCQNALRLLKFCRNNYSYVNSDSALLPYISAFYKSNSRRSIELGIPGQSKFDKDPNSSNSFFEFLMHSLKLIFYKLLI